MNAVIRTPAAIIGGDIIRTDVGPVIPVINPSTEEVLAEVPVADRATVDSAVRAAASAFDAWSDLTPLRRDELLNELADAVMARQEEFADLEARNAGKPLPAARDEVAGAARRLRYFGGAGRTIEGKAAAEYAAGRTSMIRRDPLGVIGAITPWNYPLAMAVWKVGPALAAGNTLVLKPSELTPLTTLLLGEVAADILPPGVLNVVPGDGQTTGAELVRHPDVAMVALTGDVGTGRKILVNGADTIKKTHLELGGKAPVIVFDDADLDRLAARLRVSSFWNAGQDCTAACRILVSRSRLDDVLAVMVDAARSITVGGPYESGTEMGPVISERQQQRVLGFLERAVADGATLATGGPADAATGYFVAPTVVTGIAPDSEIARKEVFGPVVTVQPFDDESEALRLANAVEYGLSASVWTENLGCALRMARKLQFGAVWVNDHFTLADEMPHGGMKMSGYGKDLSPYAIEDYTVVKHVMARFD